MPEVAELDKAWLAGFLDGEGCFQVVFVNGKNIGVKISITHTSLSIIKYIHKLYGGDFTVKEYYKTTHPNWKPSVYYRISCKGAMKMLIDIYPYLKLKKPQADLMIKCDKTIHLPNGQRLMHNSRMKERDINGKFTKRMRNLTLKSRIVAKRLKLKEQMHLLNKKGR